MKKKIKENDNTNKVKVKIKRVEVLNLKKTPVKIGEGVNAIPLGGKQRGFITINVNQALPIGVKQLTPKSEEEHIEVVEDTLLPMDKVIKEDKKDE